MLMIYLEVLVASSKIHKDEPLTYSSDSKLPIGSFVLVPLGRFKALGIVVKLSAKPSFAVKPIIKALPGLPLPKQMTELAHWLSAYYPAPLGQIYSLLLPANLANVPRKSVAPVSSLNSHLSMLPKLNTEQQSIVEKINAAPAGKSILLHGDTGTGKTRIYIELAEQSLKASKNVLILVPEIGLAPQLERDFEQAFEGRVRVTHSGLTQVERRKIWEDIAAAPGPLVVIGPRSALFSPFKNLGLIVVDEAHESAYKQEQTPYYDARRVAGKLAAIYGARLVYGSATPLVSEYYLAEATKSPILRLERLAASDKQIASNVEVVMSRDKAEFSRHPGLSDKLLDGISAALSRREQSLVFLNRRGTAKLVLCQSCGWQALCPNCDLPLTYHGDQHILRCHTCGHKDQTISTCPSCGGVDILFRSYGTKSITEGLAKLFPGAKIQRFDSDSLKSERLEHHFKAVSRGEVDILVGTQMLAKGLDLTRLSFVGVVSADTALSFPDYTASERTYQMLTQVLGRVSRGHRRGSAVVQTFQPDSPAIQAALSKDWNKFYAAELEERRKYRFPPYKHVLKITCSRKTISGAIKASDKLVSKLRAEHHEAEINDPSPSFYERSSGEYRWQILVKSGRRSILSEIVQNLPSGWIGDLDPSDLL
jgi:primosomal protein N' (replication factor Y) (superfamily II helicase)